MVGFTVKEDDESSLFGKKNMRLVMWSKENPGNTANLGVVDSNNKEP